MCVQRSGAWPAVCFLSRTEFRRPARGEKRSGRRGFASASTALFFAVSASQTVNLDAYGTARFGGQKNWLVSRASVIISGPLPNQRFTEQALSPNGRRRFSRLRGLLDARASDTSATGVMHRLRF